MVRGGLVAAAASVVGFACLGLDGAFLGVMFLPAFVWFFELFAE